MSAVSYFCNNNQIYQVMGIKSKIGWTDHTLNFWTGCRKVSAGCKFCYMYRDKSRYGLDPSVVQKAASNTLKATLRKAESGDKIFVCSWSDFFIEEADGWRQEAWDIIRSRPDLIFQILTKRPERIKYCLPSDWGTGWDNVWLGVSVENQKAVNERLPRFNEFPAKITFISVEPLLESIDLLYPTVNSSSCFLGFDWVIVGGESGNNAGEYTFRECKIDWIYRVVKDSKENFKSVFIKQLGTYLSAELSLKSRHGDNSDEFPENLRLLEFPR